MSDETLRFDGRSVVVTGGARGIGLATTELLARRGARVVVNDTGASSDGRPDEDGLAAQVAQSLRTDGFDVTASVEDSSTPEGARALVDSTIRTFGRLDVVVANAGISWPMDFEELQEDDVARSFSVNAFAPLWLTQAAWPYLIERDDGRVVTVASAGVFGYPDRVHYTAAKAAVIGLTRALAFEGRTRGIAANCVLPWAYTRLSTSGDPDGWLARHIPPESVAATIAWLAHTSCPVSGELFSSAGRHVARTVLGLGPGAVLREPTPEALAEQVDAVLRVEPVATPRSTGRLVADIVRPALDGNDT